MNATESKMKKLSKTMEAALWHVSNAPGGHGVGTAVLTHRTAEALKRRGLVVLGYVRRPGMTYAMRWAVLPGVEVDSWVGFTSDADQAQAWKELGERMDQRAAQKESELIDRIRAHRVKGGRPVGQEWEDVARAEIRKHGWPKVEKALNEQLGVASS